MSSVHVGIQFSFRGRKRAWQTPPMSCWPSTLFKPNLQPFVIFVPFRIHGCKTQKTAILKLSLDIFVSIHCLLGTICSMTCTPIRTNSSTSTWYNWTVGFPWIFTLSMSSRDKNCGIVSQSASSWTNSQCFNLHMRAIFVQKAETVSASVLQNTCLWCHAKDDYSHKFLGFEFVPRTSVSCWV